MSTTISVAAPPSTNDAAAQLLATMAALSGVATDYNPGSQVRTFAESFGSIVEQQGIAGQALALQAFVYSAMAALGITPAGASPALGTLTFSTAPSGVTPPPAVQDVAIPVGTLGQTAVGIQVQTLTAVTLASGTTSINVAAQAVTTGTAGNVVAGAVTQIISGLSYPLSVTNGAPFTGGAAAETISSALARLAAKLNALGLSSPVAVADAVVGVVASGTNETVAFSAVYEPWVAAGSGAGSGTAGFTVFIDNGTGAASSGLIAAAISQLNGSVGLNLSGYRPAGVPYQVEAVTPVYANVTVSGASAPGSTGSAVSGAIVSAIQSYFGGLVFAAPAEQSQIAASSANAAPGLLSALTVSLYASGSGTAVAEVAGGPGNRIILSTLTVAINP